MNLADRIPREFYRLFASKYMDYYQQFLIGIYEESARSYSLLGLTETECRSIMNERIAAQAPDLREEEFDEEGELLNRTNMASICLKHLEDWGWLRRDYDEVLDSYVVSFPEYSQMFVELFVRLHSEEHTRERESVLAVYSYLYTYSADKEKNNEILKSALQASRALLQMLANMQEGMRGYFDELSRQRSFLGIQEVLVKEINNSDSRKYAILTTTDSFYRYKEAVKELIAQNLSENEDRRQEFLEQKRKLEEEAAGQLQETGGRTEAIERGIETEEKKKKSIEEPRSVKKWEVSYQIKISRIERMAALCEEATNLICRIEREFDAIERRYNKLIEQKTVFASRAAARIRYILMEGAMEEDRTVALVKLLNQSNKQEELLEKLAWRMKLTGRYRAMNGQSLYRRKNTERAEFQPQAVVRGEEQEELDGFILKPLYTRQEIDAFRKKNERNGVFTVTEDTVQSMEDLEKLFFVWQDAVEIADSDREITIGQEFENPKGYRFSELKIKE